MNDIFTKNGFSSKPILMLAPMEGITNALFREILSEYGAPDFVVTEFIRITSSTKTIRAPARHERCKLQIQFMASEGEALARVIENLKKEDVLSDNDWIDLNVGCPSRRVNSHGAGAALLLQPVKLKNIVQSIRSVHEGPISIKTRIGFQSDNEFPNLISLFSSLPIDFLTLHARTRCGGYKEPVRRDLLVKIAAELSIPLIANGDINSAELADEVLSASKARGVMCGRGAVRNPLLFNEIRGIKYTRNESMMLSYQFAIRYVEALVQSLGNIRATGPTKEFLGFFSQNPLIGREVFENCKRMLNAEIIIEYLQKFTTERLYEASAHASLSTESLHN